MAAVKDKQEDGSDNTHSGQQTDSDKQAGRHHTELGYHDGPILGLLLTCEWRESVNYRVQRAETKG